MSQFIDRRLNAKHKSTVNRQRFLHRFRNQIKKAVEKSINKRSITDMNSSEKLVISKKDIQEPIFKHKDSGINETVFVGNKEFAAGDRLPRPPAGGGKTSMASNEGEDEDDFVFSLSSKEFLDVFFDDLALPEMVKRRLGNIEQASYQRAGYTSYGTPNNLSIIRSIKQAAARRIASFSSYRIQLKQLEKLLASDPLSEEERQQIQKKIELLKRKLKHIPFIDENDLRFRHRVKIPLPSTQAVMFCIMDVSGSMDEGKKEIAKRFFLLLYVFLKRYYQRIELVFIRHHTSAKEVDEQEFFYSRETGGTVVSSALELMNKIICERFPSEQWNIYAAQASDGDNWNADSPYCQQLLVEEILKYVQYYAYVEINPRNHQSLWESYEHVKAQSKNFSMKTIENVVDIYPVFHELFKRVPA